ncbi:calcium-transporting atpase [Holotrichia oblita]|nr:calcium-transporting atpase [Holotrichia oblita]
MKHYLESAETVMKELDTTAQGLSSQQAAERLGKNGKNKLDEAKKTSIFARLIDQLTDPMIIILIVAAVVSGITSTYAGEGLTDVFIILIVVAINAILGVYQESKAESAIEALQKMTEATTKVLRNGSVSVLKSEDLVVGDVVVLEAGDAVPADGRIIECASMKIEESPLTGESVAVDKILNVLDFSRESNASKDVPLGDRKNMVYMGSTVVYGRGVAVVTSTGMQTEMGKIAGALADVKEEKTPLQKKLLQLSKFLSYAVVGICIFIFFFKLFTTGSINSAVMIDTFMIAVSLAVAAIPEGLATVVTIVLSIGVTNMSKKNAVIRKLTAVETLGCAQIICSDKTGTLTQNKMSVVENYSNDELLLVEALALCSDASLDDEQRAIGEPTECALVDYALKLGLNKNKIAGQAPRIAEAPFDSTRKMMSTVHSRNGKTVRKPLTKDDRAKILAQNKAYADRALRVLGAAYKEYPETPKNTEASELEKELIFVGLVGMIDPVRPEVKAAIKECGVAGIRPIMITGDHKDTAVAIAKELGIIKRDDEAITGAELDMMSDEKYEQTISQYGVYARVKPENKVRIVNTWRKKGFICAMTGDGVNDSPSIKSADIGIGMGITGTDVTKNVADMVLADDNFATIVTAVSEGRKIFDNIRKAIQFLLASNLSEVLSIFIATVMGFTILKPVHLLWINLVTDTFPALALGMEKGEEDAMKRPPRDPNESIFARGLGANVLYQGIMVAGLAIAAYFIGHYIESGAFGIAESSDGVTMAFLTMSMAEIFHSFNMRSEKNSIFTLKTHNPFIWAAMVGSLLMTTLVIYVPFLSNAFGFESISLFEFAIALGRWENDLFGGVETMNLENYERISEAIEKGEIGDPKCIRVYKTCGVCNVDLTEAVRLELYEDIKFISEKLGEPELIYAKTVGLENTIIMIKHKNKKMSHLALNLFREPILNTFRAEVAGDKGLIDYDSDKSIPVFFNKRLELSQKDYSYERQFCEADGNEKVLRIIDEIMSRISGGAER